MLCSEPALPAAFPCRANALFLVVCAHRPWHISWLKMGTKNLGPLNYTLWFGFVSVKRNQCWQSVGNGDRSLPGKQPWPPLGSIKSLPNFFFCFQVTNGITTMASRGLYYLDINKFIPQILWGMYWNYCCCGEDSLHWAHKCMKLSKRFLYLYTIQNEKEIISKTKVTTHTRPNCSETGL